jgi:hypothetical protein
MGASLSRAQIPPALRFTHFRGLTRPSLIYQLRYAYFTVFAWDIADDLAMFVVRPLPSKSKWVPDRKFFA